MVKFTKILLMLFVEFVAICEVSAKEPDSRCSTFVKTGKTAAWGEWKSVAVPECEKYCGGAKNFNARIDQDGKILCCCSNY